MIYLFYLFCKLLYFFIEKFWLRILVFAIEVLLLIELEFKVLIASVSLMIHSLLALK